MKIVTFTDLMALARGTVFSVYMEDDQRTCHGLYSKEEGICGDGKVVDLKAKALQPICLSDPDGDNKFHTGVGVQLGQEYKDRPITERQFVVYESKDTLVLAKIFKELWPELADILDVPETDNGNGLCWCGRQYYRPETCRRHS